MEFLRRIAVFLIVIGIGSVVLNQFGYTFTIISWLDDYQPAAGLGIGALGVALLVLTFVVGKKPAQQEQQAPVAEQG